MHLHAALDGDGAVPLAYVISRVCEEFACTPSAALHELDVLPLGFVDDIVEARHYARAKALVDRASSAAEYRNLPESDLMELAKVHTFERANERRHRG